MEISLIRHTISHSRKGPRCSSHSGLCTGIKNIERILISSAFSAYLYLCSHWDDLIARDLENNVAWFLYGRSQGLQKCGLKKIVFKQALRKDKPVIKPYVLDEDVIVYSGIFTTIDINLVISPKKTGYGIRRTTSTHLMRLFMRPS